MVGVIYGEEIENNWTRRLERSDGKAHILYTVRLAFIESAGLDFSFCLRYFYEH